MTYIRVELHKPETIKWWESQHRQGLLDLDPPYQRKSELWSRFKQAHLIDSIINGFDIPKFYVADFTRGRSGLNKKGRPYAVVDGKQRFGAIFNFLAGDLKLNGSSAYEQDSSARIAGMDFLSLQKNYPDLADRILSFKPVVMSIATDDENKVHEMFVRLNSGEAVNSAEKRNARPGPVPVMVRELASHPFFLNRISFNKRRMAEYNLAAKLLMLEYQDSLVDTKARNMDRFVRDAFEKTAADASIPVSAKRRNFRLYEEARDRVFLVLEMLSEVFEQKDKLLSAAGHIPIYYWVVRNHPEVVPVFRKFLMRFTGDVISAMRASRAGEDADQVLLSYYTHSRTTNDEASLKGRYKILLSRLRRSRLVTTKTSR